MLKKFHPDILMLKKASAEEHLSARCRPYGDLIVWKQIVEKSSQNKSPVIFITDDGKEDWWLRFKGQTIGPRPELIEEFVSATGLEFHMYHPERFLSLAGDYLKQENPISVAMLDEVRNLRVKEQVDREIVEPEIRIAEFKKRYEGAASRRDVLSRELSVFIDRLESVKGQINYYERERKDVLDEILEFGEKAGLDDVEDSADYEALKVRHNDQIKQLSYLQEEHKALVKHVEGLKHKIDFTNEELMRMQRRYYSLNEITAKDL